MRTTLNKIYITYNLFINQTKARKFHFSPKNINFSIGLPCVYISILYTDTVNFILIICYLNIQFWFYYWFILFLIPFISFRFTNYLFKYMFNNLNLLKKLKISQKQYTLRPIVILTIHLNYGILKITIILNLLIQYCNEIFFFQIVWTIQCLVT